MARKINPTQPITATVSKPQLMGRYGRSTTILSEAPDDWLTVF